MSADEFAASLKGTNQEAASMGHDRRFGDVRDESGLSSSPEILRHPSNAPAARECRPDLP
jgi:hypothetical protein